MPGVCVTSTSGGGGKTLLSLALARLWSRQGIPVKPFKKGPDYIDAAWLAQAAAWPCTNLDAFFLDVGDLRRLYCSALRARGPGAVALIEGNRGLYDGLDESGSCSTASIARALSCKILICVDCAKSTRTIAALLQGLLNFESGLEFCGVILNKIGSSRHEQSLRRAIEASLNLKILGALPRLDANPLPERHMGLASMGPDLADNARETLDGLADFVGIHCDTAAILSEAAAAPALSCAGLEKRQPAAAKKAPVIGYVKDRALWFYYPENLQALRDCGARLVELSLLPDAGANADAWEGLDGLYLGGGFPEDFAGELSASPRLGQIYDLAMRGMPIYAECGGFVLLCASLRREGATWPLAGLFDGQIDWHERPRGLGYVEATVIGHNPFFPEGMKFRGHEFHYSSWRQGARTPQFQLALNRGTGLGHGRDGLLKNRAWGSYVHIFAPAVPVWAPNFVAACLA